MGAESTHFQDNNNARNEKPFRFSLPGLSVFSDRGYLRVESSAENLGSRLFPSLSFFGIPMIEAIFQPVACDMECGVRGGTCGTSSGVGGSIGTREGDGAVDGRLRIGRRSFGGDLMFPLSDDLLTP